MEWLNDPEFDRLLEQYRNADDLRAENIGMPTRNQAAEELKEWIASQLANNATALLDRVDALEAALRRISHAKPDGLDHSRDEDRVVLDEAIAALRQQEPVQSGWIPVGERLPEEYLHVLICKQGALYPIIGYYADRSFRQDSITEYECDYWMPLPAAPVRKGQCTCKVLINDCHDAPNCRVAFAAKNRSAAPKLTARRCNR